MARNWSTSTVGNTKTCSKSSNAATALLVIAILIFLTTLFAIDLLLPAEADYAASVLPTFTIVLIEAIIVIVVFVFGAFYLFKLPPIIAMGATFILAILPGIYLNSLGGEGQAAKMSAWSALLLFSLVPIALTVLAFLAAGAKTELTFAESEVRYFFGYGLGSVEKKYAREKIRHLLVEKHEHEIPAKQGRIVEHYGTLKLIVEFEDELILVDAGNWDDTLFDGKALAEFFGIPLEQRVFDADGKLRS